MNRRTLFVTVAATLAVRALPAHAQTAAGSACTAGFVDGLVQLNADCLLPLPFGMTVAPPSHLVSLTQALDAPPVDTAALRQRPGPRQRAKQRAHDRRKRRHGRHHHGHGGHGSAVTTTIP